MKTFALCCSVATVVFGSLAADVPASAPAAAPAANQNIADAATLQAPAKAAQDWLKLTDAGDYAGSWNQASALMKLTMPQDEWVTTLNGMRKPLGSVVSRTLVYGQPRQDPEGLPKGDYFVLFFNTDFSGKAKGQELITLYRDAGEWNVLNYFVD